MFTFKWKMFKNTSPKERLGSVLKMLGLIQILLGVALAIASFTAIDIDRNNMVVMEANNKTIVGQVIIGLDAGSIISSIGVFATGILPCCMMSGTEYNIVRSKVLVMVFSIVSASLFAPVIFASALAGFIMRNTHVELAVVTGVLTGVEFFVAFIISTYCCCSPWWSGQAPCQIRKKRREELKEVFVQNAKKEMENTP